MTSSNLADYDVGVVLGVGTVGTIYAATKKQTEPDNGSGSVSSKQVAIKKLHPTVSQDPVIRARFRREMLILERLSHRNIIAYYGGGDDNGQLYYIMELVNGGTVKELLEARGRLSWQVVAELGRQVCSALQYAHNQGVIHRDLKPGNLFLTRDGQVKLGDFGIARDLRNADLTSSGMTVGTHAYMAPEQITGDSSISGSADLYALGCCLYEMLVGRKVFSGENFAQLFEQHLKASPPRVRDSVPNCPESLDQIIDQLLSKDPMKRPFNARSVQGVMIELDEPPGRANPRGDAHAASAQDVSADSVIPGEGVGHAMLVEQLQEQLGGRPMPEVSWGKLVAIAIVVIGVITAASLMKR